MSDLKLPNVPEGYFWVVTSDNPGSAYPRCYVKLERRTLFGLWSKTVASSDFYITSRGTPFYPALNGSTSKTAILNKAEAIYRTYFGNTGPSAVNYSGTYYTND